jgi:hypothetical protein
VHVRVVLPLLLHDLPLDLEPADVARNDLVVNIMVAIFGDFHKFSAIFTNFRRFSHIFG